jgi:hypothetical protein
MPCDQLVAGPALVAKSHRAVYGELLQDFLASHRSGTRTS